MLNLVPGVVNSKGGMQFLCSHMDISLKQLYVFCREEKGGGTERRGMGAGKKKHATCQMAVKGKNRKNNINNLV